MVKEDLSLDVHRVQHVNENSDKDEQEILTTNVVEVMVRVILMMSLSIRLKEIHTTKDEIPSNNPNSGIATTVLRPSRP